MCIHQWNTNKNNIPNQHPFSESYDQELITVHDFLCCFKNWIIIYIIIIPMIWFIYIFISLSHCNHQPTIPFESFGCTIPANIERWSHRTLQCSPWLKSVEEFEVKIHWNTLTIMNHHISSYIIINHHISSYIIINHHISSLIIINHHISSLIIINHHWPTQLDVFITWPLQFLAKKTAEWGVARGALGACGLHRWPLYASHQEASGAAWCGGAFFSELKKWLLNQQE